jgi:hypothetical protein
MIRLLDDLTDFQRELDTRARMRSIASRERDLLAAPAND